ncbi:MAG: alpha/beta hydrolase [Chloroflexi bacterium]|nr:alpha/beta hydrolase [Chloroflexota bacterium]
MQTEKIEVNGTELHYVEEGTGDPVVFVHGALGDFRTWSAQVRPFAERYHTISYSRRAHYPNAWPSGEMNHSMLVHVADLAALITDLGLAPTHIVGNSYGAYTSLMLALRHPNLVRTLTLGEPPLFPVLRRLPGGEEMFQDFMDIAWSPAGEAFARGDMEGGVRSFLEGAVGQGAFTRLSPRARESMMKNAPPLQVETQAPYEVYMPDFTCEDASKIEVPTLLLYGERSPRMHYLINDELARCLPHTEKAIIPRAAHVLQSDNPEAHNEVVLAFLARH